MSWPTQREGQGGSLRRTPSRSLPDLDPSEAWRRKCRLLDDSREPRDYGEYHLPTEAEYAAAAALQRAYARGRRD